MIVVDTSVWVAAKRKPSVAKVLHALIDADEVALALPVRMELWSGVAKHDRRAFLRAFAALPQLVPTEATWQPLQAWIAHAADAGERFAITDLLIASLTHEIDGLVWSLDHDFARMERLRFVNLYAPAA